MTCPKCSSMLKTMKVVSRLGYKCIGYKCPKCTYEGVKLDTNEQENRISNKTFR